MTTRDAWITSGILSGVITFAQGKLIDDMLDTVSMPATPAKPAAAPAPAPAARKKTKKLKTTGLGKAIAVIEGQRITVARAKALVFASETESFAQVHLRDALGIRTDLARDLMAWLIREDYVYADGFDGDKKLYRISGTGRAVLDTLPVRVT